MDKVIINKYLNGEIINKEDVKEKHKDPLKSCVLKLKRVSNSKIEFLFIKEFEPKIGSISKDWSGKQFEFIVRIDSIIETTGPVIMKLYDGSGFIEARTTQSLIQNLKTGDIIKVRLFIRFKGKKREAELMSYKLLGEDELDKARELIKRREEEKAKPETTEFLIRSDCYSKLKQEFVKAASIIRNAIFEARPIIIRHHADCDGYSGAIALERAILPLIAKEHGSESATFWYYKRAPSRKPFYEYSDATKDLSFNLDTTARKKPPLIIIVDNGSTREDLLGIKKVKIYDAKVIVIDHHLPIIEDGRVLTNEFVDAHINPHLVGYDGNITAGMLSFELARFINKDFSSEKKNLLLPALSGVGDKSNCAEQEEYLRIAAENGFSKDYLKKLAECVDFEAYYLGFVESRSIIDDLLGGNVEKQEKLIELLREDIEYRKKEQIKIIKETMRTEEIKGATNGIRIVMLDLENISLRSEFPPPGKITGLAYWMLLNNINKPNELNNTNEPMKKQETKLLVLGIASDYVTIRTNIEGFNTNKIIDYLQKRIGFGFISGGGHENAGTVKFISGVKERVIDGIKEFLKENF